MEIENTGAAPVDLLAFEPRMPSRVQQQEVFSSTAIDEKHAHRRICRQISEILIPYTRYALSIGQRVKRRLIAICKRQQQIDELWIADAAQADMATDQFLPKTGKKSVETRKLLQFKIDQLHEIEARLKIKNKDVYSRTFATLQRGEKFSRSYIFTAKRRPLSSMRYNVAFTCTYKTDTRQSDASCGISFSITPTPAVLTLVAIAGAYLGVALDNALRSGNPTITSNLATSFHDFATKVGQLAFSYKFAAAAITAILFYQIYETTEIGKKINTEVSWRSALVIGSLCGLLNDKIIAMFLAFVGIGRT